MREADQAPVCINPLCNKPCSHDGARYRPVCSACHKHGGARPGAVNRKTYKCENVDGRLGFPCVVDWSKVPSWWRITQLDHKDGNHMNNTLDNIQELCNVCHPIKSHLSGDLKGYRY